MTIGLPRETSPSGDALAHGIDEIEIRRAARPLGRYRRSVARTHPGVVRIVDLSAEHRVGRRAVDLEAVDAVVAVRHRDRVVPLRIAFAPLAQHGAVQHQAHAQALGRRTAGRNDASEIPRAGVEDGVGILVLREITRPLSRGALVTRAFRDVGRARHGPRRAVAEHHVAQGEVAVIREAEDPGDEHHDAAERGADDQQQRLECGLRHAVPGLTARAVGDIRYRAAVAAASADLSATAVATCAAPGPAPARCAARQCRGRACPRVARARSGR